MRLRPLLSVADTLLTTQLQGLSDIVFVPRNEGDPQTPEPATSPWCRLAVREEDDTLHVKSNGGPVLAKIVCSVGIFIPGALAAENALLVHTWAQAVAGVVSEVHMVDSPITHHLDMGKAGIPEAITGSVEGEGGVDRYMHIAFVNVSGLLQRIA